MPQFCARWGLGPRGAGVIPAFGSKARYPGLARIPGHHLPRLEFLTPSTFSPLIDAARGLSDSYLHQKSAAVSVPVVTLFPDSTTTRPLSTMSAMERTKSESEVSMKDVDDEVDDYEEVKPTRPRWENAINHASFRHRRSMMNLRLNTPKMRWKLTRVTSPKKRSVCALSMAT